MFCRHKWEIISEKICESSFEHAMKEVAKLGQLAKSIKMSLDMANTDRKLIQIVTCAKCGKIKKFESII